MCKVTFVMGQGECKKHLNSTNYLGEENYKRALLYEVYHS